jgi:hypothetical protein
LRFIVVAQYSARPQTCRFLRIFVPKKVPPFYHSPYSPDLSPPDYFLFLQLKMKLKLLNFLDVAEIQGAVTDELKKFKNRTF